MIRRMKSELLDLPIETLSSLLVTREISPVDLIQESVDRIDQFDSAVNSFISRHFEAAFLQADAAAFEIGHGRHRGPLHGVPVAVKDNLYTRGSVTTIGSKIHSDFVPPFSATAVDRLADAGAISLGKTNLHEYALGVTSQNSHYGDCCNPWDISRITGGSSGGSAAAVACGFVKTALGSDTSGSIRIPASICGVVGLKPTYGRVSTYGCFPEARTLDHVGPITATVADAAIVFDALSGHDPHDPGSLALPATNTYESLCDDARGVVIGIEEGFFFDRVDARVQAVVWSAIDALVQMGAILRSVHMPALQRSVRALTIIDTAETSAVHACGLRDRAVDYGEDVRALLELGHRPSAVDYLHSRQVRREVRSEFEQVFVDVDVIVSPTLPLATPFRGELVSRIEGAEVDVIESLMRLVGPANLVGLPSISVPCGLLDDLPLGLQIIGPALGESTILNVGAAVETARLMQRAAPRDFRTAGGV